MLEIPKVTEHINHVEEMTTKNALTSWTVAIEASIAEG
jgi:hypothetical protein